MACMPSVKWSCNLPLLTRNGKCEKVLSLLSSCKAKHRAALSCVELRRAASNCPELSRTVPNCPELPRKRPPAHRFIPSATPARPPRRNIFGLSFGDNLALFREVDLVEAEDYLFILLSFQAARAWHSSRFAGIFMGSTSKTALKSTIASVKSVKLTLACARRNHAFMLKGSISSTQVHEIQAAGKSPIRK